MIFYLFMYIRYTRRCNDDENVPVPVKLVKKDPMNLEFVEQTPELCLMAIDQNPFALRLVKDQTTDICKFALSKATLDVLRWIRNLTDELIIYALSKSPYVIYEIPLNRITPEIFRFALQTGQFERDNILRYISNKNPSLITDEVVLLSLKLGSACILELKNIEQTPEICAIAIENAYDALKYIKNPTHELCLKAINKTQYAYEFVPEKIRTADFNRLFIEKYPGELGMIPENLRTAEICKFSCDKTGYTLKHVPANLQTEEMALKAIELSKFNYEYIIVKTPKVKKLYREKYHEIPYGEEGVYCCIIC